MDLLTIINISIISCTVVFLIYVIKPLISNTGKDKNSQRKDIEKPKDYITTTEYTYYPNKVDLSLKVDYSEEDFIKCMVKHYFKGDTKFTETVPIKITPAQVIEYHQNKRLFPFNTGCSCTVEGNKITV